MASLDLTSFDAALKQHYTDDRVMNMVYMDNPLLAMIPKMERFGGRNLPIPIIHGNPQGRSATFSTAQSNKTASQIKDFVITRVSDYGLASIDNETLEASIGNANAFMEAATTEIDGVLNSVTRSLAVSMYRDSSGWIGQVNAEPSEAASTVITMKNTDDITNIEVNQVINIYSAKSGGSQRSLDGSTVNMTVSAVDRDAGTFTISTAYDSSGTIAANDYIFVQGDRGSKLTGLEGWLPYAAPTSGDSHFGVDRSADPSRLAGIRLDISSKPIEEGLVDLAARICREGGRPSHAFLSYTQYSNLEKALGSKVQYVNVPVTAEVGFQGIALNTNKGVVKVIADQNALPDYVHMLQMDTWKLYSIGKAPKILMTDGLRFLRESSSDGVEVRTGYYAQLGCRAPGFNGVGKLV